MNEVLAPLFYVFRNDPDETNAVRIMLYMMNKLHECFHFFVVVSSLFLLLIGNAMILMFNPCLIVVISR